MFKKILGIALMSGLLVVGGGVSSAQGVKRFPDVPASHPNSVAIYSLVEAGVITGYPDGTFKPERPVNRAEMAAMIVRGFGLNLNTNVYSNCFDDVKDEWFAQYVCYGKKTIDRQWLAGYPGTNEFRPVNTINQVEALRMILDAYEVEMITDFDLGRAPVWYDTYLITARSGEIIDIASEKAADAQMTRGDVAEFVFRTRNFVEQGDKIETVATGNALDFVLHQEDYEGIDKIRIYQFGANGLKKVSTSNTEVEYRQDIYQSDKIQYHNGKIYAVHTTFKSGGGVEMEPPVNTFQFLEIDPATGKSRIMAELDDHHYILKWKPTKDGILVLSRYYYSVDENGIVSGSADDERLYVIDAASGKTDLAVDTFGFMHTGVYSNFFESAPGVYTVMRAETDTNTVRQVDYDANKKKYSSNLVMGDGTSQSLDVHHVEIDTSCMVGRDFYYEYSDVFTSPSSLEVRKFNLDDLSTGKIYEDAGHGQYLRVMYCNSTKVFMEQAVLGQTDVRNILINDTKTSAKAPVKIAEGILIDANDDFVVYERNDMLYAYELSSNKEVRLKVQETAMYDNIYVK